MDKRIILSVAGSGKTSEIIRKISYNDRAIIVTYTENNYKNIKNKIINKFEEIPPNVKIYTYFSFLYKFCFAPLKKGFLTKGLTFSQVNNKFLKSNDINYYMNLTNRKMYYCRLAKLCKEKMIDEIVRRVEKYSDELIVDEVQDFSGNDFNFLMKLCNDIKINVFMVGDFYQHTYDTSRDGGVNKNLYSNIENYKSKIKILAPQVTIDDDKKFLKSKRCTQSVCDFIKNNLNIEIEAENNKKSIIKEIKDKEEISKIINNDKIVKLFFKENIKYDINNTNNWGNAKGNTYEDICVVLNKNTYKLLQEKNLQKLATLTRNKLYVACSRTANNLFLINEALLQDYRKE